MSDLNTRKGWDRRDCNVRMSKRRKQQLLALAPMLPDDATPTDIIDFAIGLALERSHAVSIQSLVVAFEEAERDRLRFADEQLTETRRLRELLESLQTELRSLADGDS